MRTLEISSARVRSIFIRCDTLYAWHIACPHHAFLHFIALLGTACLFVHRNRSLGTDAPEGDAGAIEVVPEDATEADQQQSEGKQLSILTPANLFW